MKVGVLTFHSALNVGAVLQAYALQTHLNSLGHQVEFIDYQPNQRSLKLRNFIGKGVKATFCKWKDLYWTRFYTSKERFNAVLQIGSDHYQTFGELQSNPPLYDAYIAGSDQIWNFGFSRKFDAAYFLAFGDEKTKRIAFSASLGQNRIPEKLKEAFTENLKRFDMISVREKNSVELIAPLAGESKRVEHICDPTFLLPPEHFEPIEERPETSKGYVVSYVLPHYEMSEDLVEAYYFVAKELSLPLINIKNPNTCYRFDKVENCVVTPQKWLGYIRHAELAICCSFHAVVFSLIYHKPFIVISPYENNRILSLLDEVGLSEHFVLAFDKDQIRSIISAEVDWTKVDEYFNEERRKGASFLRKAMEA